MCYWRSKRGFFISITFTFFFLSFLFLCLSILLLCNLNFSSAIYSNFIVKKDLKTSKSPAWLAFMRWWIEIRISKYKCVSFICNFRNLYDDWAILKLWQPNFYKLSFLQLIEFTASPESKDWGFLYCWLLNIILWVLYATLLDSRIQLFACKNIMTR